MKYRTLGFLLLSLISSITCQPPSSTPYLNLHGNLPNHSFVEFSELQRSPIACYFERTTCCTDINNGAHWVNPHGVEINAGLDRDGLHVEYGVMIVELLLSVSEDVKPVSGMYSCDARLDGAHSGRNQVYVGLYTFGGKKRFEYFVCVITKSKCMLISTHYFGGKKIYYYRFCSFEYCVCLFLFLSASFPLYPFHSLFPPSLPSQCRRCKSV